MFESHYAALLVGYATALAGWLILQRLLGSVWPQPAAAPFRRPWISLCALLGGVAGVLVMGQLYQRGWTVPERGAWRTLAGVVNQTLIFSPALLVIALRRESPLTAWLGRDRWGTRLLAGAGLATLAILAYTLVRSRSDSPPAVFVRVFEPGHLDEAVQVFFEDLLIAALFVRLAAVMTSRGAIVLVAVLFAAGHVPAMLSNGATANELLSLVRDVGLALGVVTVLAKSRDIVWFFCVHFAMDMLQFDSVVFGP